MVKLLPLKTLSPREGQKLLKELKKKKYTIEKSSTEMVSDHRLRVPIWNPSLELDVMEPHSH